MSTYKLDGKTDLWLLNSELGKKNLLLENREVMSSGRINKEGNFLFYNDAKGTNSWDIFKLDIKKRKTTQITNDIRGQFNIHLGDDNGDVVFAKSGDINYPIPKIEKINTKSKESTIFNNKNTDTGILDFDIINNKIIAITYPFKDDIERHINQKNNEKLPSIEYNIVEVDFNGKIINNLINIKAEELYNISISPLSNSIIIAGKGIFKNETGFYKIDLKNLNITKLLTEDKLKLRNQISHFAISITAYLSSNEEKLYFVALPVNTEIKDFSGIKAYTNALYCYNIKKDELTNFLSIPNTFITDISITYQ